MLEKEVIKKRDEDEEDTSKIYSHSKLWLFESCPEAYKIKYIDKIYPEVPMSIELFLGDIIHRTLEWLYIEAREGRKAGLDDFIKYFAEIWRESFSDRIRISNGGAENYYFNKGIKFLINYYKKNEPFSDNTIHIEKKIIFPLDENGEYKIRGFVDRIVKVCDGEYEVHDYKTNEYIKSQEQVDEDRQLAFYHLGLQELFGKQIKIKLVWHFLAHNKTLISLRQEEELEKLKKDTLNLIKNIESTKNWQACGKRWCDWCAYKRLNGLERWGVINKTADYNNRKLSDF